MALPKHGIETSLREFFKATIAGGLLFLLPVVLILIVLRHAMRLAVKVTKPISDLLPVEAVLGVRRETFLAVLLLILISLVAGLVAKTNAGRRFIRWCENSFLGGLPQYQLVKSMAEGLARVESAEGVQPALVSIEDGWQIAYLLEFAREWLGYCISAAGAYPYVGQRDVPADGSGTAIEHHDGPGHDDRETHWRRIRRNPARRRP